MEFIIEKIMSFRKIFEKYWCISRKLFLIIIIILVETAIICVENTTAESDLYINPNDEYCKEILINFISMLVISIVAVLLFVVIMVKVAL